MFNFIYSQIYFSFHISQFWLYIWLYDFILYLTVERPLNWDSHWRSVDCKNWFQIWSHSARSITLNTVNYLMCITGISLCWFASYRTSRYFKIEDLKLRGTKSLSRTFSFSAVKMITSLFCISALFLNTSCVVVASLRWIACNIPQL